MNVAAMRVWARSTLWVLALGIAACSTSAHRPNLAGLYNDLAQHEDPDRNPIVLIPGLMGSRLTEPQSGRIVWGAFGQGQVDPKTAEGARLFALPLHHDTAIEDTRDGVQPDGALDSYRVNLLGVPVELNAYYNILSVLGIGGYRDQGLAQAGVIDYGDKHFTCFQYGYDWRKDIVENARALDRFLREKEGYVKDEINRRFGVDKPSIRFDIIAHSMGGLVARYYLRYGTADLPDDGSVPEPTWAGARFIGNLIMIGTPNGGAMDSLTHLIDGYRPSILLARYPPAVLGTFPSLYQMLPRGRHHALLNPAGEPVSDLFDPELWKRYEWGLADPGQTKSLEMLLPDVADPAERRRIAMAYQAAVLKRAGQFTRAMDLPVQAPESVRLLLVAGDAAPTPQTARITSGGRLEITAEGPGDGVVLRRSALMDERQKGTAFERLISPIAWDQTLFLFSDHIGLTEDPAFTDNVLYFLLERPRSSI